MMMKEIVILAVSLVVAGCATVPRKPALSFDDAVRASVESRGPHAQVDQGGIDD